jgi:glycosyltransferase involved in cell wall biosynthesis
MKLSILIPARNEEFLGITIRNILDNIEGDTEIITVLDGYDKPIPEIPQDKRVRVIKLDKSIGQRAATNLACKLSDAKYVIKCDAHVAFSKGFDRIMMDDMQDNWTMLPLMRNLHAFDWICDNGHRRYQGPEGICIECKKPTHKEIMWIGKDNPQSTAYRFDKDLHFQYWNEYKEKQIGDIVDTMTIPGSCFMMTREKYLELNICDEEFGSWGQQGVEVCCKTWLSGGRVVTNKKCWYAHLFRTQSGFSFPYSQSGSGQERARELSKDIFKNNKWPKAIHTFQWLIDKFSPIPGWEKEATKGILYYTDNLLDEKIANRVRGELMKVESSTLPIVSVSLKPIEFGENIALPLERGYLTCAKQIVAGLELLDTDIVFFCEHDVLYHPSHFNFTPTKDNVYYYNTNSWMLRLKDGHCLYYDHRSLSGMSCYRKTALKHFKERIKRIEALIAEAGTIGIVKSLKSGQNIPLKEGIHRLGFEPGTHNRPDRIDDLKCEDYVSQFPNVDIRHDKNLTQSRWSIDKFRNKPKEWIEADEIPFWGKVVI